MTQQRCNSFHPEPPFTIDVLRPADASPEQLLPPLESLLPSVYREEGLPALTVPALTPAYLTAELGLGRLDGFVGHHWFWLLGSPALPRPLHDCVHRSRTICVTERMDRHLGLGPSAGTGAGAGGNARQTLLYLKPLPRLLLDVRFWQSVLGGNSSSNSSSSRSSSSSSSTNEMRHLWACSLGFLYSYAALVPYESDFRIAQRHGLLPAEICWDGWRVLGGQVASCADVRNRRFHQRFLYGELRLHRLREVSQLRRGGLLPVLAGRLERLAGFFQNNLRSLASLLAYTAVVLSALQTGLTTDSLAASAPFQTFATGFTVFALVGPLAVVLGCALYFGLSLLYHISVHLVTSHLFTADDSGGVQEDVPPFGQWDQKSEA